MLRSVSKYSILFNSVDAELFTPSPLVQVWPQRCRMTGYLRQKNLWETVLTHSDISQPFSFSSTHWVIKFSSSQDDFIREHLWTALSLFSQMLEYGSKVQVCIALVSFIFPKASSQRPLVLFCHLFHLFFYSPSIQICYSTSRSYNCILELISSPFLHQKSCVLDFHIRDYMIRLG